MKDATIKSYSVSNKVLSLPVSHNYFSFSVCGWCGRHFLVSADEDSLCVFGNKNHTPIPLPGITAFIWKLKLDKSCT